MFADHEPLAVSSLLLITCTYMYASSCLYIHATRLHVLIGVGSATRGSSHGMASTGSPRD